MSAKKKEQLPAVDAALAPVNWKEFRKMIRHLEQLPPASEEFSRALADALRHLRQGELGIVETKVLLDTIERIQKQLGAEQGAIADIRRSSAAMVHNMDATLALLQKSTDNLAWADRNEHSW